MDLVCCHDNWQDRYAHKDASGHNVDGMEDMNHNGNDDATKVRDYVLCNEQENWKITLRSYINICESLPDVYCDDNLVDGCQMIIGRS